MRFFALVTVVAVLFGMSMLINGCDEGMQMAGPVIENGAEPPIKEPETPEDPVTTMGDMKDPGTQTDVNPFQVARVGWYENRQATHPITDIYTACVETRIYVQVVFSKPVEHAAGNDRNVLPALFIAADDAETRFEILPHRPNQERIPPNTGKKVHDTHGTTYLCAYELPTGVNSPSTIALRVGKNTVDAEGNLITGNLLHPAPFTITEMPPTVTLPNRVFIPPTGTVLSKNEKDLKDFFALTGRNPTDPGLQKARSVDRITLLPLKDREEVYDALVAAVNLPFFAEAAEKMKSRNLAFASLFVEAVKTKNWEAFNDFLENMNQEIGIQAGKIDEAVLARIYFEENPKDRPISKQCSCYWMLLEYYRLQLQYPQLRISAAKDRKHILCLYQQSARAGNVLGLANPWN